MAAPHLTTLRGISDAAIYALTEDSVSALTYGAKVDISGIQEITITPEGESSEIKGDDGVVASRGKIQKATVSVKAARLSLDVLSKVYGSSVVDSGSGTTEVATLTIAGTDVPPQFKIAGQCTQVDTGLADATFVIYKCTYTGGGEIALQTDEYATMNFDCDAVLTINNNKIADIVYHETLVPLA